MFMNIRSRFIEYLVLANALMFIVSIAAPATVIRYLAVTPAHVFEMPWTLITNMFIHADLTHIFFNMFFGVIMFGGYLEGIIGEKEFIKTYFIGGVTAALFYVFFSLVFWIPHPLTPAVGASGAVFAAIGALVVLRPNMKIYLYFFFPMPLYVFAGLYTLYGLFAIPTSMGGDVAVTAHLGGLLAGLVMGYMMEKRYETPSYTVIRYY